MFIELPSELNRTQAPNLTQSLNADGDADTLPLQDVSWLDVYLSDIPHLIYQVDSPNNTRGAQHATLANKGNEAMGYLQFIIDYYDRLPASAVFLHGYRCPQIPALHSVSKCGAVLRCIAKVPSMQQLVK